MELKRRTVLKGGLAAAAQFLVGCGSLAAPKNLLGFRPVPTAQGGAMPIISSDYEYDVIIPWGTPLQPDGPAYRYPATAENQAQQVGVGHDGMAFFPTASDGKRGLLAINHEYGRNDHVLGKTTPESLEDVRTSQHAHGAGVVEIQEIDGQWQTVKSNSARRIHGNSLTTFSGPVANSPYIKNSAANDYRGTFSNCSNGETPWNTYLTCEENFNMYFAATADFNQTESQKRYGVGSYPGWYGWHLYDKRFDLSAPGFENESNRFGWVMEIDPFDATQVPVKRTALGRLKHEGAATVVNKQGRMVVYMGDDQIFEHIYKFVSADDWQTMQARGVSPLDEGVLYVARFDEGGSGEWLPLTMDNPVLTGQFKDQADILVNARLAATAVGATPMDRPEWTTVAPNGDVYCTLTNNDKRTEPNAANPQAPNPNGHIIKWRDEDDHTGTAFSWDIFLMADEVSNPEGTFGSPDGLWADPDGRLFIMTDISSKHKKFNQLLVADTGTGEVRRLLVGVPDCEVTGIAPTPDRRTLFVNLQHPGNGKPDQTSFPAQPDGKTKPRDATLVIRRKDGGIVGS